MFFGGIVVRHCSCNEARQIRCLVAEVPSRPHLLVCLSVFMQEEWEVLRWSKGETESGLTGALLWPTISGRRDVR